MVGRIFEVGQQNFFWGDRVLHCWLGD